MIHCLTSEYVYIFKFRIVMDEMNNLSSKDTTKNKIEKTLIFDESSTLTFNF